MDDIIKEVFAIDNISLDHSEIVTVNDKRVKKYWFNYSGDVPAVCPNCNNKMYSHGTRDISVNDTPLGGVPVIINISFKRMRCPSCKNVWKPEFPELKEEHKLTQRAYSTIANKCLHNTFSEVAHDYSFKDNTAKNVFTNFLAENEQKLRFKTPVFMGIDEIKIKKLGEVTVITDLEHRTLYDMLLGRNQKSLMEYFMNMPDRETVKWVCSDMYRPFKKSIGETMPNARWAIDHFHVVMKANEAVDEVRRTIQKDMDKDERINTKRGLAYTLKKRTDDMDTEESEKIKAMRDIPKYKDLVTAFDLKEDFFNIYDNNYPNGSKENAMADFESWEQTIPEDKIFEKFRELATTVHNFYDQIFNYWECPIHISNGYTECTNRIIRENNLKGRGYTFEVLRGRTLYRRSNIANIEKYGLKLGPAIITDEPLFRFDSTSENSDVDEEPEYEPFPEPDYED